MEFWTTNLQMKNICAMDGCEVSMLQGERLGAVESYLVGRLCEYYEVN